MYALVMVVREPARYTPAVIAVAFSGLLVATQFGLLLGFLAVSSRPIELATADLWVGPAGAEALGYGSPVSEGWRARLAADSEIEAVEPYLFGYTAWKKPDGGTEQCFVAGSRLGESSLGALGDLPANLRGALARAGTVAVYESEAPRLGLGGDAESGEVGGQPLRVAGVITANRAAGMTPGLFGSLHTARAALPQIAGHEVSYLLARCAPGRAEAVARRLGQQHPDMAVLTAGEFARRTQWYWLTKTRAGMMLGFVAGLSLVVGAVITAQTLYATTAAAKREFAVLRAQGIPHRRVAGLVLAQAAWVAVGGALLAAPATLALARLARGFGVEPRLPVWLLAATALVTTVTALVAGLVALRSLRSAEPAVLLR